MDRLEKIVVALDFSAASGSALEAALFLARPFGAELHLVHAFEVPIPFVGPSEVAVPQPYLDELRDAAARKLEKAREKATAAGARATTHLREVPAAPAIARVAEEVDAQLVVMGTRGLTGLRHVLLGSVAERTLRLAPCPVLTVKAEPGS